MGLLGDLVKTASGGVGALSDVALATTKALSGDLPGAVAKSQKLLVDSKKFLDGAVGLGADMVQVSKKFGDNPFVRGANSPPLIAAQTAIFAMKATTGTGEPENGDDFEKSADLFAEAVETLIDATPKSDRWDGTAAQAYTAKNDENRRRTSDMNAADEKMRQIMSTEASQVADTRKTLTEWSEYLYDFGLATAFVGLVPGGGAAAKLVLDSGAAATALGVTGYSMQGLVRDSLTNASQVREQIALYQRAADEQEPAGGACDPFPPSDPKAPRVPPTRLDPPIPNQAPAPEQPQSPYPPAVPLNGSQPLPAPSGAPHTSAAPAAFRADVAQSSASTGERAPVDVTAASGRPASTPVQVRPDPTD